MQSIAAGLKGTNSEQLTSYSGYVRCLATHNWSGYTVFSPARSPTAWSNCTAQGVALPAVEVDI